MMCVCMEKKRRRRRRRGEEGGGKAIKGGVGDGGGVIVDKAEEVNKGVKTTTSKSYFLTKAQKI